MVRQLNEQKFCGWCGNAVTYKDTWASTCSNCLYNNYHNPKPCSSVIVHQGDKVLLVKRAIEPAKDAYDLPGGFMDMDDDSMESCVYRELEEETGLAKDMLGPLDYFGSGLNTYEWQDSLIECACFYFTTPLNDESKQPKLDPKENSGYVWGSKEELPNINLAWDIDKQMLDKFFQED